MIIINGETFYAKVFKTYADEECEDAFDQACELQESGFDVAWLHIPGLAPERLYEAATASTEALLLTKGKPKKEGDNND